jgi:alginate O-acetyltransferase complex protein AlgI
MVFSSLVFLCIFLPIVFVLNCLISNVKIKNGMLIAASLLFYAYGEPVYVFLMLGSTVLNYLLGLIISASKSNGKTGRAVVVFGIIINLLVLAIFKYLDFFVHTVTVLTGAAFKETGIALPIGISFYTFQAMSYVIDVYRGDVKAQKSYFKVLLYISFFPQLIAGPIVKYHDIENQLTERKADAEKIAKGLRRFIIGLSKKVLVSNVVAGVADTVFALSATEMNVMSAWIGAVAYMLQIYYDFSGYSDMAIGLGAMFGFDFQENFRHPYSAVSIQDFWRKWHISLSTWFKEYLYIPLGGNRKGRVRAWLNRLIVFFFTGLWHGANYTFVLWGVYYGILLFIEDLLRMVFKEKHLPKIIGHLYTLLIVCIGFVMFWADTVTQGIQVIGCMFTGWNFDSVSTNYALQQCTPLFIFTVVIAVIGQYPWLERLKRRVENMEKTGAVLETFSYVFVLMLLALCLLSLSSGTYNPFIYFRF